MRELFPETDLPRLLGEQADRPPRVHVSAGGSKADLTTIAGPDCWCGRPQTHDWPGRDTGSPHPRYPD